MREWQKGTAHAHYEDTKREFRLQQLTSDGCGAEASVPCLSSSRALKGPDAEQFRKHCLAGHRPWRPDCTACLDAMSYTRPHRRMQKSRACTLSIDISGPFRSDKAGDYEVAKPKYMLVGAYTFPVFDTKSGHEDQHPEVAIPTLEQAEELLREGEVDAVPVPSDFPEGQGSQSAEVDEQQWDHVVDPPAERTLTAAERKSMEGDNKKWETIMATCKSTDYCLVEIPFAVVLPAKSTHAIIGGLNRMYAKLRSMGLPVYRLHSDCAQEFTHTSLRQWANHRGIHVTTTMPESKASNGRAERLIGRLKQQVRALLSHHKLEAQFWPHALCYAVESLQRTALHKLGQPTQPLVPFYSLVRFRSRSWRDATWGTRAAEGRLVAPCHDISKGYIVRVLDKDGVRFYATTLTYKEFYEPTPDPEVQAEDTVATELHVPRHEVGWPPPPGAGEIEHEREPDVGEPSSSSKSHSASGPGAAPASGLPHLPPSHSASVPDADPAFSPPHPHPVTRHRITSKTPRKLSKEYTRGLDQAACVGHLAPQLKGLPAEASVATLQAEALMLSKASFEGLNAIRAIAVLNAVLSHEGAPAVYDLAVGSVVRPHTCVRGGGVESLLLAIAQQCCPDGVCATCTVCGGEPSDLEARIRDHNIGCVYVVPLTERAHGATLWVELNRGSVVQGDVSLRPTGADVEPKYGQTLPLQAWHGCLVDNPLACHLEAVACVGVCLLFATGSCQSRVDGHAIPSAASLSRQATHRTCVIHEDSSWGEPSHATSSQAVGIRVCIGKVPKIIRTQRMKIIRKIRRF